MFTGTLPVPNASTVMFQLIYASIAARALDEDDLAVLVEHARQKNEGAGITGVLVYRNGTFLHVLEGDDEATVRRLFETIRADDRHQWITLLKASSLEGRDFPGEALAFRNHSIAAPRSQPLGSEVSKGREASRKSVFGEGLAHETLVQFEQSDGRSRSSESAPLPRNDSPRKGRRGRAPGNASDAAAA